MPSTLGAPALPSGDGHAERPRGAKHFGRVDAVAAQRELALTAAYVTHPERFVNGRPCAARPPEQVLLNPADGGPITADRILGARGAGGALAACSSTSTTPVIRRGQLYIRDRDHVFHMVDIQYSRWNDAAKASFTLNAGIYVPGVTSTFRKRPDPEKPKPSDCCISVRVGMLTHEKHDLWWELSESSDHQSEVRVGEQISRIIRETIRRGERFSTKPKHARRSIHRSGLPRSRIAGIAATRAHRSQPVAYSGTLWGSGRHELQVPDQPAWAHRPCSSRTTASVSRRTRCTGSSLPSARAPSRVANSDRSGAIREVGTSDFLGRFGIGLLSCFVVADEITVITQSAAGKRPVEGRGRADAAVNAGLERDPSTT